MQADDVGGQVENDRVCDGDSCVDEGLDWAIFDRQDIGVL